jgi:hypothetical protein
VVNAVPVVILVSIVAATLIVERVMGNVPLPKSDEPHLGERVLVAFESAAQHQTRPKELQSV